MSGTADPPATETDGGRGITPPPQVRTAVRLMQAGAVLTALLGLARILDADGFRDAVTEATGDQSSAISANGQLSTFVLFMFVVAGVWLLVARGCRRGRRRYRVAATVFGALFLFSVGWTLVVERALTAYTVVSVVIAVVAAAVLWLLYQPEARRWFTPTPDQTG